VLRLLIADDEPAVRSALRLLLRDEPGIYVVAEAEGIGSLEAQLDLTCPDMMLLDWELPGIRPDRLLPALRVRYPGLKVVALSVRPEARAPAAAAGVDAFVSKGSAPEELLSALAALRRPSRPEMCLRA
jgi:DNA-binding NarL/FixJ family response regulator